MERENAKIRRKYLKNERARIQKLVETSYAAWGFGITMFPSWSHCFETTLNEVLHAPLLWIFGWKYSIEALYLNVCAEIHVFKKRRLKRKRSEMKSGPQSKWPQKQRDDKRMSDGESESYTANRAAFIFTSTNHCVLISTALCFLRKKEEELARQRAEDERRELEKKQKERLRQKKW